jgi:hypothetical protein
MGSELTTLWPPSAVLSDGVVTVPLWAVSTLTLTEAYQLPPVGSAGLRAVSQVHDDTLSLSATLVGAGRFAWKLALEQLAEASRRGTALSRFSSAAGVRAGGLILIAGLTVHTDVQVQSLTFTTSAARRDVIDVQLSLVYLPLPSLVGKLLDTANVGVRALHDLF